MIQNMRDLGGIRSSDGRVIRHGMLVRSAALVNAEPEDLVGISTVIDIRTTEETLEKPDITFGQEYLHLPVFDEAVKGVSHESKTDEVEVPKMDIFDMRAIYAKIVSLRFKEYSRVLRTIMSHDFSTGAVLWHCTEGKDRCGLTTAMLLEILGIPKDAIMEDYLKTNLVNLEKAEKLKEKLLVERGEVVAERFYRAMIADASYLEAAWDEMGDNYISDRLKIEEPEIMEFREKILS
ncbi:MAG: tyrosine-protein phosphatase [Parasporobacterium sp.]|nr:tyrosine-protein phosphatase [Parasporobacterium sp.]